MLTLDEGRAAVALARKSLSAYVSDRERLQSLGLPQVFEEHRGVFVTLHENRELRGCIGYPEPIMPLGKAIIDSAIHAGTKDPRFPPVVSAELDKIVIEVTILTKPQIMDWPKDDLPSHVEVGRHGLIVTKSWHSGLLLPQVATEWDFDSTDFLCQTCMKAGLPVDAWLDPDTEVRCFEAQIFSETGPQGMVEERLINSCDE